MNSYRPVLLIILDGFGIWREERGNPILKAKMPNLTQISRNYPGVALISYGMEVGLAWGEMGNSEVGHINIGAGTTVYQSFARIQMSIQDSSFFKLKIWADAIAHAQKNNSAIHLAGLVSNGGVHSHQDHLFALLKLLSAQKIKNPVYIHVFTDGRDAAVKSAPVFIEELQKQIRQYHIGQIATMSGRYYAMDRDKRWERTELTFKAMVDKKPEETLEKSYAQNITDEFVKPTVFTDANNQPLGLVKENDVLIFFNFRPDRMRQITELFLKSQIKNLFLISMTEYDRNYKIPVAFPPQDIEKPLAYVVSQAGKQQLHIAETEKYAHITYFLNGGREEPFDGEDRLLIPSPKVPSYDKKPEMAAYEITEKTLEAIAKEKYELIAMNFANGDMVGHTGNFDATVKAVETIDECIGKIYAAVEKYGGSMVITADHGNCEEMINLATGQVDTEHSTNPVPCWIITPWNKFKNTYGGPPDPIIPSGILADVAPTVLELLKLSKVPEMSGRTLLNEINPLVLK